MTVELVEWAGGDRAHARAAWASTKKDMTEEEREARTPGLLKFLATQDPPHMSPFRKSYIEFNVDVDQASHYQTLKHRVGVYVTDELGVEVNVESARYRELGNDRWYVPEDWPEAWKAVLHHHAQASFDLYHQAVEELTPILGRKRARESARFFLPGAHVLTMNVSFNFESFMHFQKLRNHPDAQQEIREIANEMLAQVRRTHAFDHSLAAFGY